MRLSRTYRAILAFVLVGFLGASGPARDGCAQTPLPQTPPSFEAWLDFPTRTFQLLATDGLPGGPGMFNFFVVSGPTPGLIQVPFTFDALGTGRAMFPTSLLNNGFDMVVAFNCVSMGTDGSLHDSGIWALTSRNYTVTDPNTPPCPGCPTAQGGWMEDVEWPGTTGGALYPHSLVAIATSDARDGSQPMLALESGPAGSFPIN